MRAGTLNSRVTIKQRGAGSDGNGEPSTTWTDVCTVWADIRHLSGIEAIKAGAELSTVKASIRIRYRSDLTAGMRVHHGSTVYEIEAVLPYELTREYVTLACKVTQ